MSSRNFTSTVYPPNSRSGFNHFCKWRDITELPKYISDNEDIVQVILEFWEYLKLNANVKSTDTLKGYTTNVKMWHLYKHEMDNIRNVRFRSWPNISSNDELAKRIRDSARFFNEFNIQEGEGRIPLTNGLLKMLFPFLHKKHYMRKEIFDALLHTKLTGNRMGEITAKSKNAEAGNFMTADRVTVHSNQIDFATKSKSITPKIELTFVRMTEVEHLSSKYGSTWDFISATKRRIAHKRPKDPLYADDQGRPLTYSDVYNALSRACKQTNMPAGSIGGHSGRIYMATYMAYCGASVAQIMKRGRWQSDAWKVYVKALICHASDRGADKHEFKIRDLAIVVSSYPRSQEFMRR